MVNMLKPQAKSALLVLADGTTYRGLSFGAIGTALGEVVFNTGMTGYQEVLTDPSYSGQIITFTYPELGNTGVNSADEESDIVQAKAVIARNITYRPSNWRSTQSLPDYLKEQNIPGIYGIDTRSLTRKLRDYGAINGIVSSEILDPPRLLDLVKQAPNMAGLNLVKQVSTSKTYQWSESTTNEWEFAAKTNQDRPLKVVAIDFGIKRNILRRLASYGCEIIVVPANTPSTDILAHNPDGIFLSNGPGDPAAVTEGIATTRKLLEAGKPTFGICMGHQILGLSLGADTFKLKFGHRGLNQPAGLQKQIEITSQNHGFAIAESSLGADVEIAHLNLNDRTVAGLRHKTLPFFSVQYHPEASPGPHDADYLFEKFVKLMKDSK